MMIFILEKLKLFEKNSSEVNTDIHCVYPLWALRQGKLCNDPASLILVFVLDIKAHQMKL